MVGAAVLVALGIQMLAAPVAAFPLTNCSLQATALRADGSTIGSIASGAVDATQDDPFLVDWNGTITYTGSSQIEMKNNSWSVAVFGIPTPLSGGDDNPDDDRDGNGTVGVSANAPFRFTGLYFVSGSITGSGGTCAGSGWFKLTGDPVGTIPFWVALGVTILGVGMLIAGARGHTITAILGGILTGLGGSALLVLFSTLPLGSPTPIIALLSGLLLGIAVGVLGRRGRGKSDASTSAPPPPSPPTSDASAPPPPPPPPVTPEEPTPA
jgi:hypothetical protein